MPEEIKQSQFDSWAIVEIMGHQRYAGYVTTQAFGGAVLFRVDVPELAADPERTLPTGGWVDGNWKPAGTVVAVDAVPGFTKLIGAGSIYAITPCTQEAAIAACQKMIDRPLRLVSVPPSRQVAGSPDDLEENFVEVD